MVSGDGPTSSIDRRTLLSHAALTMEVRLEIFLWRVDFLVGNRLELLVANFFLLGPFEAPFLTADFLTLAFLGFATLAAKAFTFLTTFFPAFLITFAPFLTIAIFKFPLNC